MTLVMTRYADRVFVVLGDRRAANSDNTNVADSASKVHYSHECNVAVSIWGLAFVGPYGEDQALEADLWLSGDLVKLSRGLHPSEVARRLARALGEAVEPRPWTRGGLRVVGFEGERPIMCHVEVKKGEDEPIAVEVECSTPLEVLEIWDGHSAYAEEVRQSVRAPSGLRGDVVRYGQDVINAARARMTALGKPKVVSASVTHVTFGPNGSLTSDLPPVTPWKAEYLARRSAPVD